MIKPNSRTSVIEMVQPRTDSPKLEELLNRFALRFERIMGSGFVATLADNVMGVPHVQPVEIIKRMNLKVREDQVIVHINTFHTKEEIDDTIEFCKANKIDNFLILTGDGSEELPKLKPSDIDSDAEEVTSVQLIKYVKSKYPQCTCAAAFNPYNDEEEEFAKLARKIDAGADFLMTQPILEKNERLDRVMREYPDIPVLVECWMSKKVSLLADLIGERNVPPEETYDGYEKYVELKKEYPQSGMIASMINYDTQYSMVEELYK